MADRDSDFHAGAWIAGSTGLAAIVGVLCAGVVAALIWSVLPPALSISGERYVDELGVVLLAATAASLLVLRRRSFRLRQTMRELAAAETNARTLFDANPLPSWVFDGETLRCVDVNPAALREYGYTRDEFLALSMKDVRVPEEWPEMYRWLREPGPDVFIPAARYRRKDGSTLRVEIHSHTIVFRGRPARLVVVEDITARQHAEEALRESESRFRQLAENIPGVVYLLSPGRSGAMLFVSRAYETTWGQSREALLADPRAFLAAVHPDDRERVERAYERRLATLDIEYRIVRSNGDVLWIQDLQFPIRGADGHVALIAGLAFDITPRRLLEEQLLHAQKMESLGRLAGGVAHDFNNLLTVIMSYADFLKDVGDEESFLAGLSEILAAAKRASSLTRQLLTFARRQILTPSGVNLNDLAAGMDRMLRHLIGEDIQIVLRLRSASPWVRADPHQIEQVIINLALNARAAMPGGGTLTIGTDDVLVDEARASGAMTPGDYVALVVADTGIGIPPELHAKVFEPFFTTRPKGEGTGLGLSTSFGIVAQFGGHIELVSEVGAGTTLTCLLPHAPDAVAAKDVQAAAPSPAAAVSSGDETLLLVEDEPTVREVAKRALERGGYRVLTATNGVEGLHVADQAHIDLLVTDIVMPLMGGRELADALRARCPRIRVLFTSGYNDELAQGGGRLAEGMDFLPKPYLPDALLMRVRQALDRPV